MRYCEHLLIFTSEIFRIKGIINLLLTTSVADLDKLNEAIQTGDMDAIVASAHSIKGASGNLGFNDLSQVAAKAEQDAKDGKTDSLEATAQAIMDELNLIKKII